MTIKIGLAHMRIKLLARKSNLDRARRLIREAKLKGAHTIILPSMFTLGSIFTAYPPQKLRFVAKNYAERVPGGNTTEYLASLAVEESIYIVGGPIIERAGPKIFMTVFIISPTGNLVGKYRQIGLNHLEENIGLSPGKELITLAMDKKYGLIAQTDLYYPEISRSLLLMGANALIAMPSLDDSSERVLTLLSARSIENSVPVMAPGALIESHGEIIKEVPTLAIDPVEGVIAEVRREEEGVVMVEVPESNEPPRINRRTLMTICKILRQKPF